jgi:hypothetical protein
VVEGIELAQQGALDSTAITKAGSAAALLLWEKPTSDAAEQHNQRSFFATFF